MSSEWMNAICIAWKSLWMFSWVLDKRWLLYLELNKKIIRNALTFSGDDEINIWSIGVCVCLGTTPTVHILGLYMQKTYCSQHQPLCILVSIKEMSCGFWVLTQSEGIHSVPEQHLTPLGFTEGRISFVRHRHTNVHWETRLNTIHLQAVRFWH